MAGLPSFRWPTTFTTARDPDGAIRDLARFAGRAAEFMRAIGKVYVMGSSHIIGSTIDGTTNPNYFAHGLGREFKGAVVVGQSFSQYPITTLSPAEVRANGQDPTKVFGLRITTAAAAVVDALVY